MYFDLVEATPINFDAPLLADERTSDERILFLPYIEVVKNKAFDL
jgi:hypothetical protein